MSLTTFASTSQCMKLGHACCRVNDMMGMLVKEHYSFQWDAWVLEIRQPHGELFVSKGFPKHSIDAATDWLDKQVNDYISWK